LGRIDQEIGNRAGSGKDLVRKVEFLKQHASKELLTKLRSNKVSINSAYNEVIKEQKRQEIIRKAESVAITCKTNFNDRCQLINNDFRKVEEIKDNSVDMIFTDPPYERKYLTLYDDLAKFGHRTLVEGGSIITYLRQYDIPTIRLQYMEGIEESLAWI
jgi:16S rRNA G966 N2-methylase RsmD